MHRMSGTAGLVVDRRRTYSGSQFVKVTCATRRSGGLTLKEMSRKLAMPLSTVANWLTLMEKGGLISRGYRWNAGIGGPLQVYRPSFKLMKVIARNELNVELLKESCAFRIDGCCTVTRDHSICEAAHCPFLGLGNSAHEGSAGT